MTDQERLAMVQDPILREGIRRMLEADEHFPEDLWREATAESNLTLVINLSEPGAMEMLGTMLTSAWFGSQWDEGQKQNILQMCREEDEKERRASASREGGDDAPSEHV
jgi:hypothetical protein